MTPINARSVQWPDHPLMKPLLLYIAAAGFFLAGTTRAADPTGTELVTHVEQMLWSKTSEGQAEMSVITPRWQRTLTLHFWMDRPDRTFVRILGPAKEAGIGSLRIKSEMWNWLPSVERVIKIPPSMMLQPWMGSDLSNDDLVKESSIVDDYTHALRGKDKVDGIEVYVVDSIPKPDAAVVWGKIVNKIRVADRLPQQDEFYDERGQLIRVMRFENIRAIGGRVIPTRWSVQPLAKPGNRTTFTILKERFDAPISDDVFTLGNLQHTR